jgi:hypothetical protein
MAVFFAPLFRLSAVMSQYICSMKTNYLKMRAEEVVTTLVCIRDGPQNSALAQRPSMIYCAILTTLHPHILYLNPKKNMKCLTFQCNDFIYLTKLLRCHYVLFFSLILFYSSASRSSTAIQNNK